VPALLSDEFIAISGIALFESPLRPLFVLFVLFASSLFADNLFALRSSLFVDLPPDATSPETPVC
jgi:hypothetical protein